MKKHLPIAAILFLGLTACGNDSEQHNEAPPPAATETDKGTKVRVGGDGVNVETDKVNIDISTDSGSVEIGD